MLQSTHRRIKIIILASIIIAGLLFTSIYMQRFTAHACCHDNCPVCTLLEACRENSQAITLGAIILSALLYFLFPGQIISPVKNLFQKNTLVSLKVEQLT